MTVRHTFKAALRRDGTAFQMAQGPWRSGWLSIDKLPDWIRFYAYLRDRKSTPADPKTKTPAKPGPYHAIYAPCVEALEALARKLKEAA